MNAWVVISVALAAGSGFLFSARPDVAERRIGLGVLISRLQRRLGERFHRRAKADMAELLGAFAGELAAGQPLAAALVGSTMGIDPVPCPLAIRAAQSGGDVVSALRLDAQGGYPELRSLAACWEVSAASGTGLASAVSRLAETARAAAAARGELAAELAATRASGRLLMLLPVFGILTGIWIGADPIHWFLSSPWGRVALIAGLTLQAAAVLWLQRITARVARSL